MAKIKILKGGFLKDEPVKQGSPKSYETPSTFQGLLKGIASGGSNLLSGLVGGIPSATSFMSDIGSKASSWLNPDPAFSKTGISAIDKPLDFLGSLGEKGLSGLQYLGEKASPSNIQGGLEKLSGGYLKPEQGTYQEDLGNVMQDIGSFVGTGGGILPAIGAAVGKQIPKSLDLSEGAQTAGAVLGGLTPSLVNMWKSSSSSSLKGFAVKAYKETYPKAKAVAKNLSNDAKPLEKSLTNIISKTEGQFKGATNYPEIKSNLKKLSRNIINKDGTANVAKVWDAKRKFNELIKENLTTAKSKTKNLYSGAVGAMNEFLQDSAKKYPKFGKQFNHAEDLFKLSNIKGNVLEVLRSKAGGMDKIKNLPYAKALLLGTGYGVAGIPGAAAGLVAKRGFDLFKVAKGNESVQKLLLDIAKDASAGNIKQIMPTITILNNKVKQEVKSAPKVKILKGGFNNYR